MANKIYLKEGGIWISKRWDYVAFDLDNPSDEGKHTNGLAVSDSPYFCAQSYSCLTLRVSEAMPVCFCVRESDSGCVVVGVFFHVCVVSTRRGAS